MSETKRLFLAIEISDAVRAELGRVQEALKKEDVFHGSYVEPSKAHITLKFLGETDEDLMPTMDQALSSISGEPCEAKLSNLDVFTSKRRINVLFMHVICPELKKIAADIDRVLEQWFEPEDRNFISHLTVARVKGLGDKHTFIQTINAIEVAPITFTIDAFVLKQSELTPEGPVYTDVKRYEF